MKYKTQGNEWINVAADLRSVARQWSGVADLTVWAGPGTEDDSPGTYLPQLKEIQIETEQTFGEGVRASEVGVFTEVKTQLTWPKATGILAHESAHARWSHAEGSDLKSLTALEGEIFMLLEEPRIEKLMVERYPELRPHLRASAIYLVNPESAEKELNGGSVGYAARILLLGNARIDAGILTEYDMLECYTLIGKYFSSEVLAELQTLWCEFQTLEHKGEQLERMKEIAVRVAELIEQAKADNGEPTGNELEELIELLLELGVLIEIQSAVECGQEIQHLDNLEKRQQQQKEHIDNAHRELLADRIFNSTYNGNTRGHSTLVNRRAPKPEEKAAAHKIKMAFEKAKYRDRLTIEETRATPPGRMRVGQVMQKQAGAGGRLEPWKKKTHKHVEDESLTLGIMCDVSGSMRYTMQPMASATWIFSEAVRRIGGKMAAVNYAQGVYPVVRPGEHLKDVLEFSAPDAFHDFDNAFQALDGKLNLLYARGARILVVCSDGNYGVGELKKAETWLKACKDHGVAVVWLGLSQGSAKGLCAKTGAQYVPVGTNVNGAIDAIAEACIKALTSASQ